MHTHTRMHTCMHAHAHTHAPTHTEHTHTYAHTHTEHTQVQTHNIQTRAHSVTHAHTHTLSKSQPPVTDQSQVLGLQEELSQRPHHRLLHGAGLIVLGRDFAVQVPEGSQQTEVDGGSRWRAGVQRRRQAERMQGGVRGGCRLAPGQALLLRGDDAQQKLDGLEALGGRLLTRHAGQASPDVAEW